MLAHAKAGVPVPGPGPACCPRWPMTLGWCMAYDPIVEGMGTMIRAPAPTYVDDLAALLNGFAQTLRGTLYLAFASWAAGLSCGGTLPT